MKRSELLARRKIWIALSDLYLDTELKPKHIDHIARVIFESPYTLEEVKIINKEEVFPILYTNLTSVAGEWSGFDEKWLVAEIESRLTGSKSLQHSFRYVTLSHLLKKYWQAIEISYQSLLKRS